MNTFAELSRATAVTLLWLLFWFGLVGNFAGLGTGPVAPTAELAMATARVMAVRR